MNLKERNILQQNNIPLIIFILGMSRVAVLNEDFWNRGRKNDEQNISV